MQTFIEYYNELSSECYSESDLYITMKNQKGYSHFSIKTKISAGRTIFSKGLVELALKKIINAKKVSEEVRNSARQYLEVLHN